MSAKITVVVLSFAALLAAPVFVGCTAPVTTPEDVLATGSESAGDATPGGRFDEDTFGAGRFGTIVGGEGI